MNNEEIMKEVEKWLTANPDAPADVVEWLRRPEHGSGKAHINPQDKIRYMDSHAFAKALVKQFSGKVQITKVASLEEAAKIMLDDMKKGAN